MSDDASKPKRFRSPPYPMFDLGRAIERAVELHSKANAHFVGVQVLAEAWGMKSVDGKVWRTAASLIQYGLLQDSGSGKARKFQITDSAKRIILDTNPASEKRREVIQKAALGPMIHRELWDKYGLADGLSDMVIKTHLTIDREESGEAAYSPSAAEEVISTYRETLAFAGLAESGKVSPQQEDKAEGTTKDLSRSHGAKVGDHVQWTSNGVVQFDARKVEWVSDDGTHLRVFGSPAGIPMDQIEVAPAPRIRTTPEPAAAAPPTPRVDTAPKEASTRKLNAEAYVVNGRLQLTADVGHEDMDALISMLTKYKDILSMLN